MATPSAKKVLAENIKQRSFKEKKQISDAQEIADKVQSLEIKIGAKSGAGDKLFGSITNADVADAIKKEGVSVDKKFISIAGGAVKRLGAYEATIRFHREVISTVNFEVIAQQN